jgi:tRNA threonylcarbamoyladenosine biosynthesis protein TsaB
VITLGIETSGHQGSVALWRDGALLEERDLSREGQRHARTLVPELRDLLAGHSLGPTGVQTIAVSIGPGSFTGLRVGVVCAKTWAYATGARLIAVDTLLAVAQQAGDSAQHLQVVSDAQRNELFVARCERTSEGEWIRHGEIAIVSVEEWIDRLSPEEVVSGPGLMKFAERLNNRCRLVPAEHWHPRAGTIARQGEWAAAAGRADDLWSLEPCYLRKSAAEEKAEAR